MIRIFQFCALCVTLLLAVQCKESREEASEAYYGNSRHTNTVLFDKVTNFYQGVTVGLTSFQLRNPSSPTNECFYAGLTKFTACDAIPHYSIDDVSEDDVSGKKKFKIRFMPSDGKLCLSHTDFMKDTLKLVTCDSNRAWLPIAANGELISIGRHLSFNVFASAHNPAELGISKSKGWRTRSAEKFEGEFWKYAASLLEPFKFWSRVTYTRVAPAFDPNGIAKPQTITKKVAIGRNNEAVCINECARIGRKCADFERKKLGVEKRLTMVCTTDYHYFSNRMNDEKVRILKSLTLSYKKKDVSDGKQQLLRLSTTHAVAQGKPSVSTFGCPAESPGCGVDDVTTIEVDLKHNIKKIWVGNDSDNGQVGTLYFQAGDSIYKYNNQSSGEEVANSTVANAARPGENPDSKGLRDLDPKDFITADEYLLIKKLGALKEDTRIQNLKDEIGENRAKELAPILESDYSSLVNIVGLQPTINDEGVKEEKLIIDYGLAGFYGFSSPKGIAAIGGVFINLEEADMGANTNGQTKVNNKTGEVGTLSLNNRETKQFDTIVETGMTEHARISQINFQIAKTEKNNLRQVFNSLSGLVFEYDPDTSRYFGGIDVGANQGSILGILPFDKDGQYHSIGSGYRLCRVDYRLFPMSRTNPLPRQKGPIGNVDNTGGIHGLRFTFGKWDGNKWIDDDQNTITAALDSDHETQEKDKTINDDYFHDEAAKSWKVAFPQTQSEPPSSGCFGTQEVSGFSGTTALPTAEYPAIIARLGFYYRNLGEGDVE